eukprot:g30544.t1
MRQRGQGVGRVGGRLGPFWRRAESTGQHTGQRPRPTWSNMVFEVFVGNIPYDATETQLIEVFSRVGPVVKFTLMHDRETGRSKGFGFAEYKDRETCLSAIRNLHNVDFHGRPLKVDAKELTGSGPTRGGRKSSGSAGGPQEDGKSGQSIIGSRARREPVPETSSVITNLLSGMSRTQMIEILSEMKKFMDQNPKGARALLVEAPQVAQALVQILVLFGLVALPAVHDLHTRVAPTSVGPTVPAPAALAGPAAPAPAAPTVPSAAPGPARTVAPARPGPYDRPPERGPPRPADRPADRADRTRPGYYDGPPRGGYIKEEPRYREDGRPAYREEGPPYRDDPYREARGPRDEPPPPGRARARPAPAPLPSQGRPYPAAAPAGPARGGPARDDYARSAPPPAAASSTSSAPAAAPAAASAAPAAPAAAAAAGGNLPPDKIRMLQEIIRMTPQQIAQLPPEKRKIVELLKQKAASQNR